MITSIMPTMKADTRAGTTTELLLLLELDGSVKMADCHWICGCTEKRESSGVVLDTLIENEW